MSKKGCGRSCATVDIQREKKARPPKTTGLIVGDERAKNDPATSQDRIAHLPFPRCREIEIKSPLGLPVDSIVAGDTRRMLVATQIGNGRGRKHRLLQQITPQDERAEQIFIPDAVERLGWRSSRRVIGSFQVFTSAKVHYEASETIRMLPHCRTRRNGLWCPVAVGRCKQQGTLRWLLPVLRSRAGDINAPHVPAQVTGDEVIRGKITIHIDDGGGRQAIGSGGVPDSGIDFDIVDALHPPATRSRTIEEQDEKHGMPRPSIIVSISHHRSPLAILHPYERRLAKRKPEIRIVGISKLPQHDPAGRRGIFLEGRRLSDIQCEIALPSGA